MPAVALWHSIRPLNGWTSYPTLDNPRMGGLHRLAWWALVGLSSVQSRHYVITYDMDEYEGLRTALPLPRSGNRSPVSQRKKSLFDAAKRPNAAAVVAKPSVGQRRFDLYFLNESWVTSIEETCTVHYQAAGSLRRDSYRFCQRHGCSVDSWR